MASEHSVDEGGTTRFFDYAEDISGEGMLGLWSEILAGEIREPKSYKEIVQLVVPQLVF